MNPVLLADSRFLDGTPSATDTAAGYDVLNIRDLRTYTAWQAASAGTKYVSVDAGEPKPCDALAIVGHNLGTAAASVSVESSPDGSDWTERLAAFTPATDLPFLKVFTQTTARHWRMRIVTAAVAPQIAVALLGGRIEFPFPPESPHTPEQIRIEAESSRSKAGHLLGTTVRFRPLTIRAAWKFVPRSFIDGTIVPFWERYASSLAPFVWAWDIDAYPNLVHFVKLDDGYAFETPVTVGGFYDSFRLDMEGVKG